ncbi:MAG: ABC transporter permease [Actinobacteria bacterium]|nr:ABC transporter permease [Actinomycetota bacterium]
MLAVLITSVVAVVASLYFVNRSASGDLANKVDEYGANITVLPDSEELPLTYGGVRVGGLTYGAHPLTMDQVALIRKIKNGQNINRVAPKLLQLVQVQGVSLMAAGVQWDQELGLKKWWQIEGRTPGGATDVLLGSRAAARLGGHPGSTIDVSGQEFAVAGVLQPTGSQEDDILFLDLATAQRLWNRQEEVSFVEVSAWCSSCPIEDISAQISTAIPGSRVSALRKAIESREILVGQFRLFSIVISTFMVLAGCLVILASTLGAVRGRRGEIGIFRAMGFRKRHVIEVLLLENLVIGIAASLVGVLLAVLVSGPFARVAAGVSGVSAPRAEILFAAIGAATLLVLISTLYPAWVASRLSPLVALRKV